MTAPVPDELLEGWADRWRYPLAVVHPDELVDGILHGLELGLSAPAESAKTLVAMGYFAAAEQLFAADKTLDALIETARGDAIVEIGRRRSVLVGRGDRVGLRPDAGPAVESVARDNLPQAEKLLEAWETQIAAVEDRLREDLRARAAGLPKDRQEAVEQCLAQSAFDAAEVLVQPDSDPQLENGPGTVPRRSRWPYSGYDLREVLGWYRTGEDPTAGFRARWRPHPDDVPARELIAAYAELVDTVDEERALWFVRTLDDVLEGGGNHHADSDGQAVQSAVAGLREPKLPVLGLPTPVPVWLSHADQPPPDGFPRPVLWVVIGEPPADPPHRVAVVTADNIFELAARGPDGQRPSAAARRVALLRMVCSQLPLA
ncbi:hypothetical protein, partial [Nonomuraea sp. NPDC005650]|uniref:hypothetical protein n=1 Tax=Nonomuraea sp. NPDC005650 TaxID=3157045 RepID=UPI0033BACD39